MLLATEKLDGDNYAKWKSNMNILLVCEDYKFVLAEECPPEPAANASKTAREPFDRWIKANNKAKCFMLVAESNSAAKTQRKGGSCITKIFIKLLRYSIDYMNLCMNKLITLIYIIQGSTKKIPDG